MFYCFSYNKPNKSSQRTSLQTKGVLKMFIEMPNKHKVDYEVPIVKVQTYTKEEIFQKNLLMFLPFYIMRYEKDIKGKKNGILDSLVEEYASIRAELDKIALENERSQRYDQLIELIIKISDYIGTENEEYLERMGTVMGGQVLELEVDKAWDRAWTEATDIATSKQMIDDIEKIVSKLNKSEAEACRILDIPIEKYNNAKIAIAKFNTKKD